MKKKLAAILLCALTAASCVAGLGACNDGENNQTSTHTHSLSYHMAVDATCTQNGNIEYWSCSGCGKNFADGNGSDEVSTTLIPALGHDFQDGFCLRCGEHDPSEPEPEPEPDDPDLVEGRELQNVELKDGVLSWDRLEIASKYAVKVTISGEEKTYDIDAKTGVFDFTDLPDGNKLAYGKNYARLIVYEYQSENIGGETIGTDVAVDSDSFIVVNRNSGYSLVRTTYSDDRIVIDGAFSDMRTLDGEDFIFIEQVLEQGTDKITYNLSKYVSFPEGVTGAFYKSDSDRENNNDPITGFNWYTQEVKAGNNRYYVRTWNTDGVAQDYNVNISCVRTIRIDLLGFESNGDGSYNYPSYTNLLPANQVVEGDYFNIDVLYELLPDDKIIFGEDNALYERGGDYTYPVISDNTYTFLATDEGYYNAQQEEAGLYKDIFDLTYNINFGGNPYWQLSYKTDSAQTSIVVPSAIYGDAVKLTSRSFYNASALQSVIFQPGFTSLPTGMFLNGCTALKSVSIPSSVTGIDGSGSMFSADLYDQLTVYCEGSNPDTNSGWDRVPGQMELFKVYTNQANACSTVRNGIFTVVVSEGVGTVTEINSSETENIVIPDIVTFGVTTVPITALASSVVVNAKNVTIGKNITALPDGWMGENVSVIYVAEGNEAFAVSYGILYDNSFTTILAIPNDIVGEVVIPESVTQIPSKAFMNRTGLTSVKLPNSIESIGYNSFYGCISLRSFIVPDLVKYIESGTFENCSSLTSIQLGTSVEKIYNSAFKNSGITSILFPQSLTEIYSNAFENTKLKEIVFPDSVIRIDDYAFKDIPTLTTLKLNNGLKEIGSQAFENSGILSLCVPGTVTIFGNGVFKGSALLTTVQWDACAVSSSVFQNCSSLSSITFTDDISSIASYAFEGTAFTEFTMPDGVISIGDYAFINCSSLRTVVLNGFLNTIGSGAFENCLSLQSVMFNEGLEQIGAGAFMGTALTKVELFEGLEEIEENAFAKTPITSAYIPDSVMSMQYGVFNGCNSLQELSLPFVGDKADTNYSISGFGYIFFDQYRPIDDYSEYIPESLISVTVRGNSVFSTLMYGAFSGAENVKEVTLGEKVTWLRNGSLTGLSALEKFTFTVPTIILSDTFATWFEGSVPRSLKTVIMNGCSGDSANNDRLNELKECKNLQSLTINNVTEISSGILKGHTSLTDLILGDEVTTIGENAFYGCKLNWVIIGKNVSTVGSGAFANNTALNTIYYRGSVEEWTNNSLSDAFSPEATVYFYSETEPTDMQNNYWHYADDGVTPVIWTKETI